MRKRPVRIEGDIAYVTLTQGYEAVIDAADVPLVSEHNWFANVQPHTVYAMRTDHTGPKSRGVLMHRVIAGTQDGLAIDHRDGDGLNNKRSNLRSATVAQNNHNRRTNSNNAVGIKGVARCKTSGKWQARIMLNGEREFLGLYRCPTAAHFAYVKASTALHGDYARSIK